MKKKIHVVSYTHWDREFRWDFETTRMWLVRLWDNLLDIMEKDSDYKYFMPDGQFVLVDDYLEVRPEKEELLRKLTAEGRLQLGPWYTLPDSSSVHGEALIRNLMTGLSKSRAFGKAMEIGYNVFSFGQISQLPQIYAGFGIDKIIFYKHMDRSRSEKDEFLWQAPDGTQALASRLGKEARWNYFFAGHIPIVYNLDPWHKDWQYEWGTMGKVFHSCDTDNFTEFHFITDPETKFHKEKIKEGFDRTIDTLRDTAVPEHLLFFDGTDFTEPHPKTSEILKAANKIFGQEYEIIHSTLEDYFKAVEPILRKQKLQIVNGHMKDGPVGSVHTDVLSVHPELKMINSQAENELFRLAEPFATTAFMLGQKYPQTLIDKSLMLMYQSQAHDSLHGVGPWTLAEGVKHRLLQSKIIAENLLADSLRTITGQIDTSEIDDADLFVVVYNALPCSRCGVFEAYIDVPAGRNIESLIIEDFDGNKIEVYELQRQKNAKAGLYHPRSRNMPVYIDRFNVLLNINDIPGLGYKALKVKYSQEDQYPYPHEDFDRVLIPHSPLASTSREAENKYVKLEINGDGSLKITNKETGKVFDKLNYFLDEGQNGNQQRCMPLNLKKTISSLGCNAQIALLLNTPFKAQFEIKLALSVPKFFDKTDNCRSSEMTVIPISSVVTIIKGSPVVEIETTYENTAKDHFLRVCFESGIVSDQVASSSVFDTEIYPVCPPTNGIYQGNTLTRHQQHSFMSIDDGTEGFTIFNDTLRDYEIINAKKGLIAQSLIRSVELRIPCDNRYWKEYPGDDSTQSLGKHTSRYGILVHQGDWQKANAYQQAGQFLVPNKIAQFAKQSGTLSAAYSFIEITNPKIVMSAFKKAQDSDSLILRIYNPSADCHCTKVVIPFEIKEAYFTNMAEERQQQLQLVKSALPEIEIKGKKIVTIEIVLK